MCALVVNLKVLEVILSELIDLCISPVPWFHKKNYSLSTGIYFFLISHLPKDSILDVFQDREYANEYDFKILAKLLLMSTGKHRNKGVHWYGESYVLSTYSCLHFIQFPLFDFSSTKTVFFSLFSHSFYRYCHCQE